MFGSGEDVVVVGYVGEYCLGGEEFV